MNSGYRHKTERLQGDQFSLNDADQVLYRNAKLSHELVVDLPLKKYLKNEGVKFKER